LRSPAAPRRPAVTLSAMGRVTPNGGEP
jgi:hypothetical protein